MKHRSCFGAVFADRMCGLSYRGSLVLLVVSVSITNLSPCPSGAGPGGPADSRLDDHAHRSAVAPMASLGARPKLMSGR
jgi:hypothetical protein